ncbi:sugar phosphate isomerase/epimerase family protein [Sphingomonas solaris]|uniref:Sugar phosphate isomerase/epimerase n=1 Tax=Alterirhizorhabdus solaris TaxID=2529389 RepID=A0A558RB70_9SPHN|nr:sugar phosphate isomerase/epimerase [Sphingomonas solaris]TVV76620.1 sugar phosphate isomerase/epimerase [Sphingomonas solaris]
MNALEIGLCWGTLEKADLPDLIEAAGRHGFPTLSIRPDMVQATLDAEMSEAALRRRLADAGVRVRVIDALTAGLPGMPATVDLGGQVVARPDADACFRVAEAVGAPIVNVALYGGQPAPLAAIAEAIGAVAERARARGIALILEFIPGTAMPDITAAHAVAQASGAANCSILLDTWHLARSGGTLADVAALPPGAIGSLQICDRTPPPPGTPYVPMTGRDLPGEGQLPLGPICAAARLNNPALTAEIEVFSAELRDMTVDAAAARVAAAIARWREREGRGL